jgi:hypothetical protein
MISAWSIVIVVGCWRTGSIWWYGYGYRDIFDIVIVGIVGLGII